MRWMFYLRSVPFTREVLTGGNLGGSESACLGLMRALARRGQTVVGFVYDLAADCHGWVDADGVRWEPSQVARTDYLHHTWDVCVALRMADPFLGESIPARYRLLWSQDLLQPPQVPAVVSSCWSVDRIAYVSAYHRHQWEGLAPDLAPLGWVTRNGYDPAHVPADAVKDWRRVIHISRPERGLGPLLQMWPAVRRAVPEAELRLCRYSSMYDAQGWGRICAQYDEDVARVQAEVGGIIWLGELGKAPLYREIAEAAVMWYPGVPDFAETSCIAAIEAQACGTPLVLSARGALPETAPHAALLEGSAWSEAYQAESVAAVVAALQGCRTNSRAYRRQVEAGRAHVTPAYTYEAIAEDWLDSVATAFVRRAQAAPIRVLEALQHVEDLAAAQVWLPMVPEGPEQAAAADECARVISGDSLTPTDYHEHALADPRWEATHDPRYAAVAQDWAGCTRLLDVACGNGAAALHFLTAHPTLTVVGVDYSPGNIAAAEAAVAEAGLADRATFVCLPIYDYGTQAPAEAFRTWLAAQAPFDACWVGEFLEHLLNPGSVLDACETRLTPGAPVVATMPHGPYRDLMPRHERHLPRGHVHHFESADFVHVFGAKAALTVACRPHGVSSRGGYVGTWIVRYRVNGQPCGRRDLARVPFLTRPQPRLSVGLITHNAASDLRRCLESVWMIADEIVVGDTGSTDDTVAIADHYGARVLALPEVIDLPGGFAEARNRVLDACTGDWFLWIDADEVLHAPEQLRKYLDTGPFRGYALKQQHLMLDCPDTFDTPVRLFKREPSIRFYGCVHEQPQEHDANGDIGPALQLTDVCVIHYGYPTERVRRQKANRNFPLLLRNHETFPERRLNKVLDVREWVLRANDLVQRDGGVTSEAQRLYQTAVECFEREFGDPADKYHALARPFYEQALESLGTGWQFETAFAGSYGSLNGRRAEVKRFRARTYDDAERYVLHLVKQAQTVMAPDPVDTVPLPRPVEETVS